MASKKIPREFVPSDVNTIFDPAIMRAGAWAELIFRRANEFSKRNRRDGDVLDVDVQFICRGVPGAKKHIQALVDSNLWTPIQGGWRINSWRKWNMTEAEQEESRVAKRKAGLTSRHKDGKHSDEMNPDCPLCIKNIEKEGGLAKW